ncbi:MAG TPA: Fe-S cluster assembly protein SufD [Steroidobacteraceae bacterium]|nr:Fe-S cluster assembly protein SufD [Steroidobacteraceae bacterium]
MKIAEAIARLPTIEVEEWRYTDLSGLAKREFVAAGPAKPSLPTLDGLERVAFVGGALAPTVAPPTSGPGALPQKGNLSQNYDSVIELNAAFAQTGLALDLPANTTRTPLHLVTWFGGTPEGHAHLRHRIRLARGASASIVLHELGDDAPFFATQVIEVELAENATLRLDRIQRFGARTTALTRIDVRVARDARFDSVGLYAGGALARNDLNVALEGPGAQVSLEGVLAPAPGEHLDVHTRIEHRAPHGTSREAFRCLVPAKARAIFNGMVMVREGAQKTDSEQHVDSLLLAPGAEVNAKPELLILADDVRCAHGATCGQLDEDALYYLRTRGLDLPAARALLLRTFAQEILNHIALEPARLLALATLEPRL